MSSWQMQVDKSYITINPLAKSSGLRDDAASENSTLATCSNPKRKTKSSSLENSKESVKKARRYHIGICRCCLSHGKFESMEWDNVPAGRTQSYLGMLRDTLGLSLSQTTHPRLICSSCAVQLRQTLAFRKQVVAAEKALLATQSPKQIKVEIEKYEANDETPFIDYLSQEFGEGNETAVFRKSVGNMEDATALNEFGCEGDADLNTGHLDSSEEVSHSELTETKREEDNARQQDGLIMCEFCSEIHAPDEYSQCRFCAHEFSSEQDKVAHLICDSIDCTFCTKSFLTLEEKTEHMKICKYFTCFLRRSVITNDYNGTVGKSKVTEPGLIKNKKNYQCDICKRDHTYKELISKHKEYRKYTCMDCKRVFLHVKLKCEHRKSCTSLENDMKKRKIEESLRCNICKTKCETEEDKAKHWTEKHLTCVDCSRVFSSTLERDEHCKMYKLQCEFCDKIFPSVHYKRRHIRSKHGIKCNICDMIVREHCKAKHHSEFHGGALPQCGICNLICPSETALAQHQRSVHMKERNTPCPECDFVTFGNKHLRQHMVVHLKTKDYQCDYCQKTFARRSNLQFHIRIHTGDKRAVCKICGEAFVQRASLKYHLEKYHPGS